MFAYNVPMPLVETNIRTVLFHHIVRSVQKVTDRELADLVAELEDAQKPREWYWALMDYGAYLKEQGVRTNNNSAHYAKQSKFKGSDREVRGAILRVLTTYPSRRELSLSRDVGFPPARVAQQLAKLKKEGLVSHNGLTWSL